MFFIKASLSTHFAKLGFRDIVDFFFLPDANIYPRFYQLVTFISLSLKIVHNYSLPIFTDILQVVTALATAVPYVIMLKNHHIHTVST